MPKKPSPKAAKASKAKAPKAAKAAKAVEAAEEAAVEAAPKAAKPKKAGKERTGPSLLVVESPAKERTISRFHKSDFIVKSSFGHVRDLPVRKIGVVVDDDFAPQYVV